MSETRDAGTGELKLARQVRDYQAAAITVRDAAADANVIEFSASSEAPVQRWFGTEILSHAASAVDLSRIDSGAAPLLFNHDWGDPIGMVQNGRLADGRLTVTARLFDTARAQDVRKMIDGGLRNISIGYDIRTMEENVHADTYTATDWMPLEVSIVTVPADPSIGIGRSDDAGAKPVRITRSEIPTHEVHTPASPAIHLKGAIMAEAATTPAGQNADTRSATANRNGEALEELRCAALTELGKQHKMTSEVVRGWINDGIDANEAARNVLDIMVLRAGKEKQVAPSELGLSKAETERFSMMKAIRAVVNKDWTKAGLELEAHKAIQQRLGGNPLNENTFYVPLEVQKRSIAQRDMTSAGASGSNYLVATDNVGFIDILRNRSVAVRMGANMMPGMTGNVTVPRQTAGATAGWLSTESTAITESQPTIGQLAMSPKHVGAYTEVSRLLMLQSSPAAESLVMNDLAMQVALAVDSAVLSGSGASGQPTGITNTSGVGSVTGTSLAYAGLLEFQTDIGNALQSGAALGYVTTAAVAALLATRVKFSSTASPLWNGSLLDADVCGFRGMSSAQVAAATMIFGDWAQVVIPEWGSLAVEVNPYANFPAGIIGIRALYAVDVGVRIPSAFSVAGTIT